MSITKKSRKASVDGQIRYMNFLKNWLHQAFTYMDTGEKIFRVSLEAIEVGIFIVFSKLLFDPPLIPTLLISFLIIHTVNWVTNCLFWAVAIFAIPDLTNPGEKKTLKYLKNMTNRLKMHNSISGLAIYGSVSRGKWHNRSDIDIRILRLPGFMNLIKSCLLTLQERFIAFITKQPMDLFLADEVVFLKKMRSDEKPIFLIKRDKRLDKMYPDNPEQILIKLKS